MISGLPTGWLWPPGFSTGTLDLAPTLQGSVKLTRGSESIQQKPRLVSQAQPALTLDMTAMETKISDQKVSDPSKMHTCSHLSLFPSTPMVLEKSYKSNVANK